LQLLQLLLHDDEQIVNDAQAQVELHLQQKPLLLCPEAQNKKTNKIPMLRCKQCFIYIYIYGNILPKNNFKIVIFGYCIHFFGSVALIGL